MRSKITINTLVGTGLVGTGAMIAAALQGVELAAGPVRFESGNGKIVDARLAAHAPLSLTIQLSDARRINITF